MQQYVKRLISEMAPVRIIMQEIKKLAGWPSESSQACIVEIFTHLIFTVHRFDGAMNS